MEPIISTGRASGMLAFRLQGDGTWREAEVINHWLRRALAEGPADVFADLGDAGHLDSTFIGSLVGIARLLRQDNLGQIFLYGVNVHVNNNLEELGIPAVIANINSEKMPRQVEWEILPQPDADAPRGVIRHVIEAHETLMELDASNVLRFEEAVKLLRDAIKDSPLENK